MLFKNIKIMDDLVSKMIRAGCFIRGEFTLRSGQTVDTYFDIKKGLGNPEILTEIADRMYRKIGSTPITFVAGSGLGGIPIATAISILYPLKLTLVRNELKNHGTLQLIEGYRPNPDDLGMIADDVFTTGGSLKETANILIRETSARIHACYVVLKRTNNNFEYPLEHLFTLEDFQQ